MVPRPAMTSSDYVRDAPPSSTTAWISAVGLASAARAEMAVGEAMYGDTFDLFEAMLAIEIMDPKMDVACARAIDKATSGDSGHMIGSMTLRDQLRTASRLTRMEAAWHSGRSPNPTVLACRFVAHPSAVAAGMQQTSPLALVVAASRRLASFVLTRIQRGDVFEPEDFAHGSVGVGLHDDPPPGQSIRELEESLKAQHIQESGVRDNEKASGEVHAIDDAGILQLHANARLHLLKSLYMLDKLRWKDARLYALEAAKYWHSLRGTGNEYDEDEESEPPPGFETIIATGATALPPQKLIPPSFPESLNLLVRTADDIALICDSTYGLYARTKAFGLLGMQDFMYSFAQRNASIISRVMLLHLLCTDGLVLREWEPAKLIKDAVESAPENGKPFGLPSAIQPMESLGWDFDNISMDDNTVPLNQNGSPTIDEVLTNVESFFINAGGVLMYDLQLTLANPCRRQRKLKGCLEDWGTIQQEGEYIDTRITELRCRRDSSENKERRDSESPNLQTCCILGAWAMQQTLRSAIAYVFLGFELNLYAGHELGYIYWYSEYLLAVHAETISRRLKRTVTAQKTSQTSENETTALRPSKDEGIFFGSILVLEIELAELSVRQNLCRGLLYYLAAVRCLTTRGNDMMSLPFNFPFNDQHDMFAKRFSVFYGIMNPVALQLDTYIEASKSPSQAEEHLLSAAVCFNSSMGGMQKWRAIIFGTSQFQAKAAESNSLLKMRLETANKLGSRRGLEGSVANVAFTTVHEEMDIISKVLKLNQVSLSIVRNTHKTSDRAMNFYVDTQYHPHFGVVGISLDKPEFST